MGHLAGFFKHAKNIRVDHPQGIIDRWEGARNILCPIFGDFHNSHNRVQDWINKTK